jgi:hypothetical protein
VQGIDTAAPFRSYLSTGERVLWSGQPKQGLALAASDAFNIPFSLLWGGFAIVWNGVVWFWPFPVTSEGAPPWLFRLFGLPFLAMGLYFIAGRFWHDARIRKTTYYAVTDQRILILRGSKFTSFDIDRLPRLDLSERRDGSGTLSFEPTPAFPWSSMNGFSWWTPALGASGQFFRIATPRKVYDIIRNQSRR